MTRRHLWIVAGVIVALNGVIALVNHLAPEPSGPRSSSLATAPQGFAAWAELARRNGVRVVALRARLADATLPAGATVVALDVPDLPRADARALRAFAERGGRVVAGGRRPGRWLALLDDGLDWRPAGPTTATRTATVPETDGVRTVRTAGAGTWDAGSPALAAGGSPLLVSSALGAGRLDLLADASPLQNGRLAEADNAAFALALSGRGPLIFAESAHGYESTGLAALPGPAKGALILLLVAAGLMMLARGRRFGPAEPAGRALAPPRVAYVDALGATLARTKDHEAAMAPVRAALGDPDLPPVRDHAGAIELAQRLKERR